MSLAHARKQISAAGCLTLLVISWLVHVSTYAPAALALLAPEALHSRHTWLVLVLVWAAG